MYRNQYQHTASKLKMAEVMPELATIPAIKSNSCNARCNIVCVASGATSEKRAYLFSTNRAQYPGAQPVAQDYMQPLAHIVWTSVPLETLVLAVLPYYLIREMEEIYCLDWILAGC